MIPLTPLLPLWHPTDPSSFEPQQGANTRHWKLKQLDMEVDDGTDGAGTSGRGGRGRAATLAENNEQERERFMEVRSWEGRLSYYRHEERGGEPVLVVHMACFSA